MSKDQDQEVINRLVAHLRAQQKGAGQKVHELHDNGHASEASGVSALTDQDVLELMFDESKRGREFEDVYSGNYEPYHPSPSEAVGSLLWRFAFYTRKDPAQMERLIRGSALPKEKFDTRRGGTTWLGREISRAIEGIDEVYEPPREARRLLSSSVDSLRRSSDDDKNEDPLSGPASERVSRSGKGGKKAAGEPSDDTGAFKAIKAGEEKAGDESPENKGTFKAFKAFERAPKDLPGVAEIPTNALPVGCRQLVREASEAIGCPADFLAAPMLAALGSAIGLSHVIEIIEGWTEAPTLWVATVGNPGSRKTPPAKEAKRPVAGYQAKLLQEYREELREYKSQKPEDREDPPVKQTCYVDDITSEALVVTLGESPRGVIQFKDELLGLIRGLDQYKGGKGSDRQFYLSSWSGESYSYRRKGSKEDILLLHPFLSVAGSIQTDLLHEIADQREDGLVDRFLFAFPNPVQSWLTESKGISKQARKSYASLYIRLRKLEPASVDEFDNPVPRIVRPTPEAKTLLRDRINGLRLEAQLPGFPSRLTWVWPKLEAYLARLTLILAMCRCVDLRAAGQEVTPRVEKDDVDRGFEILNYFKSHARRVYGLLYGHDPKERLLEDLGRFILLQGGSWRGTPTELHEQLESDYKPERAAELSKFLKHRAETRGDILYATKIERVVLEDGRQTTRNVATLGAPSLETALNALNALNIGLEMGSTRTASL